MKYKLGIMVIVFIVGLICISTSYASFVQPAPAEKEVLQLADHFIGIRSIGVGDNGPDPDFAPGHNDEGKDVASTTLTNGAFIRSIETSDGLISYYDGVHMTISNAYPWYATSVLVEFINFDELPGQIESINQVSLLGDTSLINFIEVHFWEISRDGVVEHTGSTQTDLFNTLYNVILYQEERLQVKVAFHFIQEIPDDMGFIHMPQNAGMQYRYEVGWSQAEVEEAIESFTVEPTNFVKTDSPSDCFSGFIVWLQSLLKTIRF